MKKRFNLTEEEFRKMFVGERRTLAEIAVVAGTSRSIAAKWAAIYGLGAPGRGRFKMTQEELREMYVVKRMAFTEIAKVAHVNASVVGEWAKRWGIKNEIPLNRKFMLTKEDLREMYINQRMTQSEIGRKIGMQYATVGKWLRVFGMRKRKEYATVDVTAEDLRAMYVDQSLTVVAISRKLGCGQTAVNNRIKEYGITLTEDQRRKRAKRSNTWGYTRKVDGSGYIKIWSPGHPCAVDNGYVAEHRLVVEKAIGRYLTPEEIVHHVNMKKQDNQINNLCVLPDGASHHRLHKYMERVCAYQNCGGDNPGAVAFKKDVFWKGQWTNSIDLVGDRKPLTFTDAFKAAYELAAAPQKETIQ